MFIKTVYPSALGHMVPFKDCVEEAIRSGFSGFWFNPVLDFDISKEEMLSLIQKSHILAMGMELPVEFRKREDEFEDDLKRLDYYASYASYIGIRRAVTWIVPFSDSLPFEDNFNMHLSRLGKILDVLDEYSIRLGLEFQGPPSLRRGRKHWFIHSLDGCMSLIAALGRRNCGVLMDLWHWSLSGAVDFDFNQFESGSDVICVHINDAPSGIRMDDQEDLSRCLPGATGILDVKGFLSNLDRIGYSGPLIAEPFDSSLSSLPVEDAFALVSSSIDKVL